MIKENRIGKFYLPYKMVHEAPEAALNILNRIVVVRAELYDYGHSLEYYGYSWLFEPCKQGSRPPIYKFEVNGTIVEARIKETP